MPNFLSIHPADDDFTAPKLSVNTSWVTCPQVVGREAVPLSSVSVNARTEIKIGTIRNLLRVGPEVLSSPSYTLTGSASDRTG